LIMAYIDLHDRLWVVGVSLLIHPPPRSTPFPYTTLFRSYQADWELAVDASARGRTGASLLSATGDAGQLIGLLPVVPFRRIYRRSEEHTSELQSRFDLVCRLLLEKKKR